MAYDITPQECRLRDLTYAAPIFVDVEYVRGRQIVPYRKGSIDRMVLSSAAGVRRVGTRMIRTPNPLAKLACRRGNRTISTSWP